MAAERPEQISPQEVIRKAQAKLQSHEFWSTMVINPSLEEGELPPSVEDVFPDCTDNEELIESLRKATYEARYFLEQARPSRPDLCVVILLVVKDALKMLSKVENFEADKNEDEIIADIKNIREIIPWKFLKEKFTTVSMQLSLLLKENFPAAYAETKQASQRVVSPQPARVSVIADDVTPTVNKV